MATLEKTTEIVQDLIKINNDRVEGFERVTKDLGDSDADLRSLFLQYASESRQFAVELGTLVAGEDQNDNSIAGALHRGWIAVKATFSGHDRKAILSECERGEDAIKLAYSNALKEEGLSAEASTVIGRQHTSISAAHDKIKLLRDSAQ